MARDTRSDPHDNSGISRRGVLQGAVAIGDTRLAWQGGRLALHPAASGAMVDGRRVNQAMYLSPGPLALDGATYRVRVLEGA